MTSAHACISPISPMSFCQDVTTTRANSQGVDDSGQASVPPTQ